MFLKRIQIFFRNAISEQNAGLEGALNPAVAADAAGRLETSAAAAEPQMRNEGSIRKSASTHPPLPQAQGLPNQQKSVQTADIPSTQRPQVSNPLSAGTPRDDTDKYGMGTGNYSSTGYKPPTQQPQQQPSTMSRIGGALGPGGNLRGLGGTLGNMAAALDTREFIGPGGRTTTGPAGRLGAAVGQNAANRAAGDSAAGRALSGFQEGLIDPKQRQGISSALNAESSAKNAASGAVTAEANMIRASRVDSKTFNVDGTIITVGEDGKQIGEPIQVQKGSKPQVVTVYNEDGSAVVGAVDLNDLSKDVQIFGGQSGKPANVGNARYIDVEYRRCD